MLTYLERRIGALDDPSLSPSMYKRALVAVQQDIYGSCNFIAPEDHALLLNYFVRSGAKESPDRIRGAVGSLVCCWLFGGGLAVLLHHVDASESRYNQAEAILTASNKNALAEEGTEARDKKCWELAAGKFQTINHSSQLAAPSDLACVERSNVVSWDTTIQYLVSLPDRILPLLSVGIETGAITQTGGVETDVDRPETVVSNLFSHDMLSRTFSRMDYMEYLCTAVVEGMFFAAISTPFADLYLNSGAPFSPIRVPQCSEAGYVEGMAALCRLLCSYGFHTFFSSALLRVNWWSLWSHFTIEPSLLRFMAPRDMRRTSNLLGCPTSAWKMEGKIATVKLQSFNTWLLQATTGNLEASVVKTIAVSLIHSVTSMAATPIGALFSIFIQKGITIDVLSLQEGEGDVAQAMADLLGQLWGGATASPPVLSPAFVESEQLLFNELQLFSVIFSDLLLHTPFAYSVLKGLLLAAVKPFTPTVDDAKEDLDPVPCTPEEFLKKVPLDFFLQNWSDIKYSQLIDSAAQQSLSTLVGLSLRICPLGTLAMSSDLVSALLEGIQFRMGNTSSAVRGCGLYVAQVFSRVFARDVHSSAADGAAASIAFLDFSGDADLVAFENGFTQLNVLAKARRVALLTVVGGGATASASIATLEEFETASGVAAGVDIKEEKKPLPTPVSKEDDVIRIPKLSVASYLYTGRAIVDESKPTAAVVARELEKERLRNLPAMVQARRLESRAPTSMQQALANLTQSDQGPQGNAAPAPGDVDPLEAAPPFELHVATLCTLPRFIRGCASSPLHVGELHMVAPKLLTVLLSLDNRFGIPDFDMWRLQSLIALVVATGTLVTGPLIAKLFGDEVSEAVRTEIVDILVMAVQEMSGREEQNLPETPWEAAERALEDAAPMRSQAITVNKSTRAISTRVPPVLHDSSAIDGFIFSALFFPLMHGLLKRGQDVSNVYGITDADLVEALRTAESFKLAKCPDFLHDPSSSPLLAHLLKAQAVLLECVSDMNLARKLVASFLPLCWMLRSHDDSSVRLGCVAGIASSLAWMHKSAQYAAPSILEAVRKLPPFRPTPRGVAARLMELGGSPSRPLFAVFADTADNTQIRVAMPTSHPDPSIEADSDDEDVIEVVPSGSLSNTVMSPLRALLNVAATSQASASDMSALNMSRTGSLSTTNEVMAASAHSQLSNIWEGEGRGATDSDMQAVIAAMTDKQTMWDDALILVKHLQTVVELDPEQLCRNYATHILSSPVIDDLVTRPITSMHALVNSSSSMG
jgi:hypothetical protein